MLYVKSKLPNSTIVSEEPVSQKHYFLCPFIFILFDCFVVYCMHVAMTTQFPSGINKVSCLFLIVLLLMFFKLTARGWILSVRQTAPSV